MPRIRQFASDNQSGMCPEVAAAITAANPGHQPGYGEDQGTTHAADLIRATLGVEAEIFLVCTGTAANSLALAACARPFQSILCHESAHIETDECGGPEFFSGGSKLIQVPGAHGLIDPQQLHAIATRRADLHYPRPQVVSLTQSTELGTVYPLEHLRAVAAVASELGLLVHMDGARFANAVASLGVAPGEILRAAGVDVLCLGGSKNGGMIGEAVVFLDRDVATGFEWRCKQSGQLVSKMRFLSAQWEGLLHDGTWLRLAGHANAMATRLAAALRAAGIEPLHPVQGNAVFLRLDAAASTRLRESGWSFYAFIGGGARFVCSWDSQADEVDELAADIVAAQRP
jgi:threonine aldolase